MRVLGANLGSNLNHSWLDLLLVKRQRFLPKIDLHKPFPVRIVIILGEAELYIACLNSIYFCAMDKLPLGIPHQVPFF